MTNEEQKQDTPQNPESKKDSGCIPCDQKLKESENQKNVQP